MMKGAIEVSIGFLIVMVISALVMIFMMGWLSSMFPQLTQISEFATAQAEQQMMNEFAKGSETVLATIPYKAKFSPGSQVHFKVGVKKTAIADDSQYFALCIGSMEGTKCVVPSEATPISVCTTDDGSCKINFKFPSYTKIETRGDIKLMSGIMELPGGNADVAVPPGVYGFRIYVCQSYDKTTPSFRLDSFTCEGLQDSYGQYDFIVQVS